MKKIPDFNQCNTRGCCKHTKKDKLLNIITTIVIWLVVLLGIVTIIFIHKFGVWTGGTI